jgi:hypothetical protein
VPTILQILTLGTAPLPGILTFRLLPFAGAVALSGEYSWRTRIIVPALYGPVAVIAAKHNATPFYWLVLAYVYFAVAGWLAHEILPSVRSNAVWFGAVSILFWVLPTALLRSLPRTFLLLGWDCVLGAYSYGVDTRNGGRSLRDFLFFLLVNPVLVYRHRGARLQAPSVDVGALARIGLGVCAVFLSIGALEFCRNVAVGRFAARGLDAAGVAGTLVIGVSTLGREYAVQSGVASLQIGCMRQLGYRVPERYRYPLLANSPGEFWRRWNTYVGGWAQTYVFVPLMFALRQRSNARPNTTRIAYAGAVVLTFAVVGLLHDVFVVADERRWSGHLTTWFCSMGCLAVIWELVVRWKARHDAAGRGGRGIIERSVFLLAACVAAAHWR